MLYEKKLMKELCEEMGIEWVEETGNPTLCGRELTNEEFVDLSSLRVCSFIPENTPDIESSSVSMSRSFDVTENNYFNFAA